MSKLCKRNNYKLQRHTRGDSGTIIHDAHFGLAHKAKSLERGNYTFFVDLFSEELLMGECCCGMMNYEASNVLNVLLTLF